MTESFSHRFAVHYRGRHRAEDALWWLVHPDRPAPSGAPPVQDAYLEAVDHLMATGLPELAHALQNALITLLDTDRRATLDALHETRRARPRS